jgi:hypothetical protein
MHFIRTNHFDYHICNAFLSFVACHFQSSDCNVNHLILIDSDNQTHQTSNQLINNVRLGEMRVGERVEYLAAWVGSHILQVLN